MAQILPRTDLLLSSVAPEGVGSFVYEVQSSITKESAQQ